KRGLDDLDVPVLVGDSADFVRRRTKCRTIRPNRPRTNITGRRRQLGHAAVVLRDRVPQLLHCRPRETTGNLLSSLIVGTLEWAAIRGLPDFRTGPNLGEHRAPSLPFVGLALVPFVA